MRTRTIRYSFMIRPYIPYRLRNLLPGDRLYEHTEVWREQKPREVSGEKSAKLFKSWFRLAKKWLVSGTVEVVETGEKYTWQPEFHWFGKTIGGWQRV